MPGEPPSQKRPGTKTLFVQSTFLPVTVITRLCPCLLLSSRTWCCPAVWTSTSCVRSLLHTDERHIVFPHVNFSFFPLPSRGACRQRQEVGDGRPEAGDKKPEGADRSAAACRHTSRESERRFTSWRRRRHRADCCCYDGRRGSNRCTPAC